MGILNSMGDSNDDGADDIDDVDEPAPPVAPLPEPYLPPPAEEAPAVDPSSRRGRARARQEAEIAARLKPFEERVGAFEKDRDSWQQTSRQQMEAIAHLRGQVEAMSRQPVRQEQQAPVADPDKLMAEAEAALENKDLRTYHAKLGEASHARMERTLKERTDGLRREFESKIPPQLHPEIQYHLSVSPNVARAGARGEEAVVIKDRELAMYGMPKGPERTAKAFKLANEWLEKLDNPKGKGGGAAAGGFDQSAAAALSAVAGGRGPAGAGAAGGGAGDDPTHGLTAEEQRSARIARIPFADYAAWKDPEKAMKAQRQR